MRRRSKRVLIACIAVSVPILTWFVRIAHTGKRKTRGIAAKGAFTEDSVEDFTPRQTALLGRVREIWDAAMAGQAGA
jgi:hypothetical protein